MQLWEVLESVLDFELIEMRCEITNKKKIMLFAFWTKSNTLHKNTQKPSIFCLFCSPYNNNNNKYVTFKLTNNKQKNRFSVLYATSYQYRDIRQIKINQNIQNFPFSYFYLFLSIFIIFSSMRSSKEVSKKTFLGYLKIVSVFNCDWY